MNNKSNIQIIDICNRLRKPNIQLSELCMLINSLGDSLIIELSDNNSNINAIKSGWDQLIEILMQTTHPTVRHIAFQNVRYFLVSKQGISNYKNILIEICNSIIKLIYHWNTDIQFEIIDIIFQNYSNQNNYSSNEHILSTLINLDIEILTYILSLLHQFNNTHYDFILINILKSFKISIKYIKNQNIIMEIIDKLCQLGKNININHINSSSKYNDLLFLNHIFDIFNNISDQFQNAKIISYKIIKDELNLIINHESFNYLNNHYYELIHNGISITTRISIIQDLIFNDHIYWIKNLWELLFIYIKNLSNYNINIYIIKIFNSIIKAIFNIYINKGLILFLWDNEINDIKFNNNNISHKNIYIYNIDEIIQFFINLNHDFIKYNNHLDIIQYICNLSMLINIGLSTKNQIIYLFINKKNLLKELTIKLIEYIDIINIKSYIEYYFIINILICKLYYIQYKINNKEIIDILNKNNLNFLNWIISNFDNNSFLNNLDELYLLLIYKDINNNKYINNKYNKNYIIFIILQYIYKLSKINNEFELYINNTIIDINNKNINIIKRIFINNLYCNIIFSKNILIKDKNNIENIIIEYIPNIYINNHYKYGKYFCINKYFKISRYIFKKIRLYTINNNIWINILIELTYIYDIINNNIILENNNKYILKLLYDIKLYIRNIKDNILIIKEYMKRNNSLFIDLYISFLNNIIELIILNYNIEENLDIYLDIFNKTLNIMMNILSIMNIIRYICNITYNIMIRLYIINKRILIKYLLLIIDNKEKDINNLDKNINNSDRIIYNIKILRYILLLILNKCMNRIEFNILMEKNFLENILNNNLLDIENKRLEIIIKNIDIKNNNLIIDNNNNNNNEDNILLIINKKNNDSNIKELIRLEYLYLRRLSWENNEDIFIKEDLYKYLNDKIDNKYEINIDKLKIDYMQLIKNVGIIPPLLLTLRSLPMINLKYELHGMKKIEDIDTKNENPNIIPTLRLQGNLINDFNIDIKYWRWARIKLSYILECDNELISDHLLDILVDEGQFDWTQPIELISNIKQLNIISTPMTFNKICIGTPTIHIVPIN